MSIDNESPPTFESALAQLEQAVRKLEEGQLGLSDALAQYEAGVRHLKVCYQALEQAERKIELLSGVDADGNPITQPFDDADLSLEKKAEARSRRRSAKGGRASEDVDDSDDLF